MMRKKWWAMGVSAGIGAVLLWGVGVSALADNSAFDAYKIALRNTKAAGNMTAHANLAVSDNGTQLFTISAEMKIDHEKKAGSINAVLDDMTQTETFQLFREEGKVVFHKEDSDVYRVIERKGWNTKRFKEDGEPPVMVEQVGNVLLGNLRKSTTMENLPDGSKRVSLQLADEQIPFIANKIGTVFFAKLAEHHPSSDSEKVIPAKLPQLKEQIQVEQLQVNAKLNADNRIEQQTAEVHLSGKDASGKSHHLVITLDVSLSDFSQTTPEKIDLDGKKVELINIEEHHKWRKGDWPYPVTE